MSITRELEEISPQAAIDILAFSHRSPSIDIDVIGVAQSSVANSTTDDAAFDEDIFICNGYVAEGYDKLSAIALSDKTVKAWVSRQTVFPQ